MLLQLIDENIADFWRLPLWIRNLETEVIVESRRSTKF